MTRAPRVSPAFAEATAREPEARLQWQYKCLADLAQGDTLGLIAQRSFEALNWFPKRFKAETERLMMDRHNEARACGVRHLNCLLGCAVRMNPWVVSADRHDRDIDRFVSSQLCETLGHCRVAGENEPAAPGTVGLDQIAIVAAVHIALFPRAPVFHRESSYVDLAGSSSYDFAFAPIEFGDVAKLRSSQ